MYYSVQQTFDRSENGINLVKPIQTEISWICTRFLTVELGVVDVCLLRTPTREVFPLLGLGLLVVAPAWLFVETLLAFVFVAVVHVLELVLLAVPEGFTPPQPGLVLEAEQEVLLVEGRRESDASRRLSP